ncbi:hypothetical protein [Prosthecomicrobium sp. N25]|uniref:hypothetical protein n=1 Tax=Prosthecomicrobium sp. N25 TaxID=3129254 RepID=UPI0030784F61
MKQAIITALALALSAGAAAADDRAECEKGIAFIKAEIGKNPAEPVMTKLKKALKDANRELGETEYDECMDAVKDAQKALGKKS